MSSELAPGVARERRLHPLSWLFVLLASLREFAFPLIALVAFGSRGNGWEQYQWWGLVGVAALTLHAVVRYYTYRFRIEGGELVIRSGVLHRNVRHIPLSRIHDVALKRNVLHRAFGVAEVKLESAVGGARAEAQMRVLSMRDAQALEALVRAQGRAALDHADLDAEPDHGETLLTLTPVEIVKAGLISNRGLLLGAAGFGAFSQFGNGAGLDDFWTALMKWLLGYADAMHLGGLAWIVVGTLAWAIVVLIARAVSILLMLVQLHGFTLRELDGRLSVESGLLTRHRSNARLRKIQHWTLRESLLHRLFARRSLRVETAVLQVANESRGLSELVPIAPPGTVDALLQRWVPWFDAERLPWRGVHPRAWRRIAFWPVLINALLALLSLPFIGPGGLALLLGVPWWILRAKRLAQHSQWAADDRLLAWRSGWLDRKLSFAEIAKLQGLQLVQSPFDRRRGMASLIADTAGASPFGHRLELRHLPVDEARALYERLGAQLARSALKW